MKILLTHYIHPIESPISVISKIGFTFDNPRTPEEIEIIYENLKVSLDSPNEMYRYKYYARIPIKRKGFEDVLNLEESLRIFKNEHRKDKYIRDFFRNNKKETPLDILSKMWIIIRIDDEGELQRMKEEDKKLKSENVGPYIRFLDSDNPLYRNSKKIVDFSYLLSLFIHNDPNYLGSSFILFNSIDRLSEPFIDTRLNHTVMTFSLLRYGFKADEPELWRNYYPYAIEQLVNIGKSIELIMDSRSTDKLFYISEMLKTISEDVDHLNMKLVLLVSLIEMLLTHNPDFNRYNVEDSINKQFQLKTSVVLYMHNKSIDLNLLKNKLKIIYSQRSNIAHGNFEPFKKWLMKEAENTYKDEDTFGIDKKDLFLENLLIDIYGYLRIILKGYIDDRDFIDYIKDN